MFQFDSLKNTFPITRRKVKVIYTYIKYKSIYYVFSILQEYTSSLNLL